MKSVTNDRSKNKIEVNLFSKTSSPFVVISPRTENIYPEIKSPQVLRSPFDN